MVRKTYNFKSKYDISDIFVKAVKRISSILSIFLSSILVKHLVVRCVSLPLPSFLFLSHFRLACPLSVPDYSIAWPLLRAHTL